MMKHENYLLKLGITIGYFKRMFNNSSNGLHRVVSFV